jgi:hypothetical protein
MDALLAPAVGTAPIPGPTWLFHTLLVFTFFLHALFMNLTLGGTVMAALLQLRSRGRSADVRTVLATRLMSLNTWAVFFAVTTGVAPLLFIQVLYRRYVPSGDLVYAWGWLAMLALLGAGYGAAWLYQRRGAPARGFGGTAWLVGSAVLFLFLAMVHVAESLIHLRPHQWTGLARSPWEILADPTYLPRLVHILLGAIAFSALVVTWLAVRQVRQGRLVALNERVARQGWVWAMWSICLLVLDGVVLLTVLPGPVLDGLMGAGPAALLPLGLALILGIGPLALLARAENPAATPGLVAGSLAALVAAIAAMAVVRHEVRILYLRPAGLGAAPMQAVAWGDFALFAAVLTAILIAAFLTVRRALGQRGGQRAGEVGSLG